MGWKGQETEINEGTEVNCNQNLNTKWSGLTLKNLASRDKTLQEQCKLYQLPTGDRLESLGLEVTMLEANLFDSSQRQP